MLRKHIISWNIFLNSYISLGSPSSQLQLHFLLTLAHRLQVLLFGMADVTQDFSVQSKHQLLRKGHRPDCV